MQSQFQYQMMTRAVVATASTSLKTGGGPVMGAFDMLRIASTSLGMHQTWLDALANNIANVNTVRAPTRTPSRPRWSIAARPAGRRRRRRRHRAQRRRGPAGPRPDHPLADADGYVRAPEIDMASQMTQLVMAQRGFQASVQVTKDAQDTYTAALQIGRR